jgi:hypothetical protein
MRPAAGQGRNEMLGFLLRILLIIVLIRIVMGVVRGLQGPSHGKSPRDSQTSNPKQVRHPPPRRVVDADFEDLDGSGRR